MAELGDEGGELALAEAASEAEAPDAVGGLDSGGADFDGAFWHGGVVARVPRFGETVIPLYKEAPCVTWVLSLCICVATGVCDMFPRLAPA